MMLSIRQIAEHLNVSASVVYALVESRRLPSHRIGNGRGVIRVAESDLDAYLKSCRVQKKKGEEPVRVPRRRLRHLKLY